MSLKPQLEAIIYAAEIPITLDQIIPLVKDSVLAESPEIDPAEIRSRIRAAIEELTAEYSGPDHGIEIRQIAGGYRMSTKPEQHDVVRAFAKSLKSPIAPLHARARNAGCHRLQATSHRSRDQRNPRRRFRRRNRHAPRSQTHHDRWKQGRDRPSNSLQDQQRFSAPLRPQRHSRTAQHGGIRKAPRRVLPERSASRRRRASRGRGVRSGVRLRKRKQFDRQRDQHRRTRQPRR